MSIAESELILNPNGSIYHLNLLPSQIANDIITVGDPDRVDAITKYFDSIEHTVHKREFKTITGMCHGKKLTVISTGIGTDNIDIVLNELDALVNIDFTTRTIKPNLTSLNIYRIGTSGAIREDINVDSVVISKYAIGLDGLMNYYQTNDSAAEENISKQAKAILQSTLPAIRPYCSSASQNLISRYSHLGQLGITTTATGFYGPQGRKIRLKNVSDNFIDDIAHISYKDIHATNLEMETAGIYGVAHQLGHHAISFNAILANRVSGVFSQQSKATVDNLIISFLEEWRK